MTLMRVGAIATQSAGCAGHETMKANDIFFPIAKACRSLAHKLESLGDTPLAGDGNFKFLVLGAGRGGTSLLNTCLTAHSGLRVEYEFAAKVLMGYPLCQPDTGCLFDERVKRFKAECLREAEKHRPLLWGNKLTTEQLYGLEDQNTFNPWTDVTARFFSEVVPEIKVIFILRDGRSCVASKVRRTGQPWVTAAFRWKYGVGVYKYLRERHGNNHCLKFEELLADPAGELRKVCAFLGVEFEDSMLHNTQDSIMPEEYRQPGFIKEKAKPAGIPEEVYRFIEDDLQYCGYV